VAARGRLDVLVNNNAPKHLGKALHEIDDEEWEHMFHTLVTELFYTTKAALKHMIPARRGKIVNIASSGGLDPYLGPFTAYCAARGGGGDPDQGVGKRGCSPQHPSKRHCPELG
jgi:NAD(P)-dependent dehydrogenase (short-subunit alcohol dehydrogenase family)